LKSNSTHSTAVMRRPRGPTRKSGIDIGNSVFRIELTASAAKN
jgi:hypothetical protein